MWREGGSTLGRRVSELSPIVMQYSVAQIDFIVNECPVNEVKYHAVNFNVAPALKKCKSSILRPESLIDIPFF